MREKTGSAAWQAAFNELIAKAAVPAWRSAPPRLVIKRGRFSPWWSPVLWFARRPSAWSAWRRVIISAGLLAETPNRYLLAHELGHVAERHHARYLSTTLWVVALGTLLAQFGPIAPVPVRVVGLLLFLCGVAYMLGLCSLRAEYAADRFAASLIGEAATVAGIADHARKSGGEPQRSARKRIAALQRYRRLGIRSRTSRSGRAASCPDRRDPRCERSSRGRR